MSAVQRSFQVGGEGGSEGGRRPCGGGDKGCPGELVQLPLLLSIPLAPLCPLPEDNRNAAAH